MGQFGVERLAIFLGTLTAAASRPRGRCAGSPRDTSAT